jgi:hypothetical protein
MQWRRYAHNQEQRAAMEAFAASMEGPPSRALTESALSALIVTHGSDGSALVGGCGRDLQHNNPENNTMKKLIFTLTLAGALALGGTSAFAQAKKKKEGAAPAEAAADKPKSAESGKPKAEGDTAKPKAEGEGKAKKDTIPMNLRADEIDASAKTITQNNKDGTKAVNTVTDKTEIKNGDKPAKFEDIKKGDWIGGLRKKTGEDAYVVVKITKFGPKAEGEGKKKPAEGEGKKPAEGEGKKKPAEGEGKKPAEGEGKKPAAEPKAK